MAKPKVQYRCKECGYTTAKPSGKCFNCGAWNSFEEVIENKSDLKITGNVGSVFDFKSINSMNNKADVFDIEFPEVKRVLGDGITSDGYYVLAGEPGIGKSTIVLQMAEKLARNAKILIITGEETVNQVAKRAKRICENLDNIFIVELRNFPDIQATIDEVKPDIVFVDSIQVINHPEATGSAGGVSQVKAIGDAFLEIAKTQKVAVILLAHVTKDGTMAGPKTLEHLVDVVLQFEGDRKSDLRFLRSVKNRFGPTDEVGILQMTEKGLIPPPNLINFLIPHFENPPVGVAHSIVLEGKRPIPVEVQALCVSTHFNYPTRTVSGYDKTRVQTLLAILEKYANVKFKDYDVYISFTGGVKVTDISCDLAICMALLSARKNSVLSGKSFYSGEVTLTGGIHKPFLIDKRNAFVKKVPESKLITSIDYKRISDLMSLLK